MIDRLNWFLLIQEVNITGTNLHFDYPYCLKQVIY